MKLNLFTTNSCNFKCTYCYEKEKNSFRMTKETARKIVDFFWDKITDGLLNINFHGGEPLLEFGLIEDLVLYTNHKFKENEQRFKVEYSMTTNGALLSKHIAEFLKKYNFDVRLSLDGTQEAHDLHRKTNSNKGTHYKVMDGLSKLDESGVDYTVRMTVTPENVDYLVDSIIWMIGEGLTKINIVADVFADWNKKFHLLEDSFRSIQQLYLQVKEFKHISINIFDGKYSSYMVDSHPLFCNAGFGTFAVSTVGSIYPCVYVVDQEDFCIGSIDTGISPAKRKHCIQGCLKREDRCGGCNIQGFCHARKCGFLNQSTTGYLDLPNPFLCKHEQLLYDIVGDTFGQLADKGDPKIIWMLNKLKTLPEYKANKEVEKYLV